MNMHTSEIIEAETRIIVPTYQRPPVVFTRGEGSYLYDQSGKRYLDFAAGIAVAVLGHSSRVWVQAVQDQAQALTHVSNLYHTEWHVALAQRLVESCFADRVFFCSSGTEANEAALKFARKWARLNHRGNKTEVLAFTGAFHGRTMGALSLTHKEAYRQPFEPLVPGVRFAPFNDVKALRELMDDRICAAFIEPIQGEAGVHVAEPEFLAGLRAMCDQHNALLIFDEVQCGLGRTGSLWAHEAAGVTPDMMTLAKPLAGGLPIGATLVTEDVAQAIEVGDHGSTFAAGPLVCRAACAVFDVVSQPDFLKRIESKSEALQAGLRALDSGHLQEVRGRGLLLGAQWDGPVKPLIKAALDSGLVAINAGEDVLRICPPLTISPEEIEAGLEVLVGVVREVGLPEQA